MKGQTRLTDKYINVEQRTQLGHQVREESTSEIDHSEAPQLSLMAPRKRRRMLDEEISAGNLDDDDDDAEHQQGSDEDLEPWEEELHDIAVETKVEIRGWKELREQIKDDLKKSHGRGTLTVSNLNQLNILRNFATLVLKGYRWIPASLEIANHWHDAAEPSPNFARRVRALARHYQTFEQLPQDHRGGSKNARSLLKDESVQTATRTWLTAQKIGTVTPLLFANGLNDSILPSLNISLTKPLCERTARRWLVKLGWTKQTLRKGVYMDGHERSDVVKYREEVFLPKMKLYERRMVKFDFDKGKLHCTEPELEPGESVLIPVWQDESCFQANDYKKSAWCMIFS